MSEIISVCPSAGVGQSFWSGSKPQKSRPNVVDVGAWFEQAKIMRRPVDYIARHRAPGPAV